MKRGVLAQDLPCLHCGKNLNFWNDPTGTSDGPKPGDITVCSYCSSILQYTAVGSLLGFAPPSKEMIESITNNPDYIAATIAAKALRLDRKPLH